MRRRGTAYGIGAALVLGLGLVSACGDSASGQPPTDEASVDGGELDVAPDQSTPPLEGGRDSAGLGIRIKVDHFGEPQRNLRVIFHDAAGDVIGEYLTDEEGVVAKSAAPSMVSVVFAAPFDQAILTYVGVADGDQLVVTKSFQGTSDGPFGKFNVALGSAFQDGTRYWFHAGSCSGTTALVAANDLPAPVEIELFPSCIGKSGGFVVVYAESASGVGVSVSKGIAKPAVGTTTEVMMPAFVAASQITLPVLTPPSLTSNGLDVLLEHDGVTFRSGPSSGALATQLVVAVPPAPFTELIDARLFEARGTAAPGTALLREVRRRETVPTSAVVAMDFGATFGRPSPLPVTDGATKRPQFAWSTTPPTSGEDGTVLTTTFRQGSGSLWQWSFVLPPGRTSMRAPALPSYIPLPVGDAALRRITITDSPATDYARFKKEPRDIVGSTDPDARPGVGTHRFASYFQTP